MPGEMNQATYNQHMTAMQSAIGSEFEQVCKEHKAELVQMFPPFVRSLLSLSWWCMTKVGAFLAPFLVQALLWYLAKKTLEEILGILTNAGFKTENQPK